MEGERREEQDETEQEGCLTTSGAVEAVSQKENRYGVRIAGEWYGAFGTCPVSKGQVCVVDYVFNGRFRNIVQLREVGDAVARSVSSTSDAGERSGVPAAVKNYRTPEGWEQAFLTAEEEGLIQNQVRQRNLAVLGESIKDAEEALVASAGRRTPRPASVAELAALLAERRTVHVSRVYDEFLRAKIAKMRRESAPEVIA